MIGIVDLIVIQTLRDGFDFVSKNPHHIRFALGGYQSCPLMVSEHIFKESVEFIKNNRIYIGPYHELKAEDQISLAVQAQGREKEQFIGDVGYSQEIAELQGSATTYSSFTAQGFTTDRDGLIVPLSYNLEKTVWIGQFIGNHQFSSVIVGLVKTASNYMICLRDVVPEGTDLRGWSTFSDVSGVVGDVGQSMDDVQVSLSLLTHGDPSVHRLYSVMTRYILKRSRMQLISYGLYNPTFSYSACQLVDTDLMRFESMISISGLFVDAWIEGERNATDRTSRMTIEWIATSPGKSDVPLG
jgi:hypothetical protein